LSCSLQVGSLSTIFLTSLALASFLLEVKRAFTNILMSHHNLRSSRSTPSHLEGFTSKSNKYHKDCFTKFKCSSAHKENSLNPPLSFLINHKILIKEGLRRAHKKLWMSVFHGWHRQPPNEGGEKLLYLSSKN
jgi:hypothetical protein